MEVRERRIKHCKVQTSYKRESYTDTIISFAPNKVQGKKSGADLGGCERCLSHGQIFRTIFTGLKFQYKYVNEDKSIITLQLSVLSILVSNLITGRLNY